MVEWTDMAPATERGVVFECSLPSLSPLADEFPTLPTTVGPVTTELNPLLDINHYGSINHVRVTAWIQRFRRNINSSEASVA